MPVQRNSTTQVRTTRVTTFTRRSLASWHLPLLLAMASANPGSKPRLDSGTEPEQFRVDTPGDEVWIYWLRVPFSCPSFHNTRLRDRGRPASVPYAPPFCWSLFSLFKCCLQLLLVSLCLMSTIFFPPLLVPNDCTSVKYASGYFSILSAPCLLARLSCITQSVFARAFSYFVFPVSCSRVFLDWTPSPLTHHLALCWPP